MGTPDFAVASLKRLVEDGHEICGVFTQPDRPKNRGHKLAFSPVKEYALSQGLSVYQPTKMRDGTALALVRELHPELIVVAAYGRILPEDILNTPPYGSINVHSSLLPKYRGAAPINWAILNGERETGVTIMYMAKELDAGDILHVLKTDIDPQEDAQTLTARLAELGAQALSETVEQLRAGTAHRTVQDHSAYTYAPMLTKDMGIIDWTKPAGHIHNQVRVYFSAIFYDPTQMTFSIGGFNMQQIIKLNPMYWYITGFRRTVMWGIPLDWNMFLVCGICAVVSMVVGLQVFRKTQDHFVLHI